MFSDADKKPADNLTKLAALDMDALFSRTKGISKGVLFNIRQSLLKDWGPDSLGVLLEDIMHEQLIVVTFKTFQNYHYSHLPIFLHLFLSITLVT